MRQGPNQVCDLALPFGDNCQPLCTRPQTNAGPASSTGPVQTRALAEGTRYMALSWTQNGSEEVTSLHATQPPHVETTGQDKGKVSTA